MTGRTMTGLVLRWKIKSEFHDSVKCSDLRRLFWPLVKEIPETRCSLGIKQLQEVVTSSDACNVGHLVD